MINVGIDTEDNLGRATLFGFDQPGYSHYWPVSRIDLREDAQDEIVRRLSQAKEEVNVWCLNLQYDLANTFGDVFMGSLVPLVARNKIVGSRLRGSGRVRFFAIERFLPKMNLAEMGDAVGLPKLELPFQDPRRVLRDAKIARVVGEKIVKVLTKLGLKLKFSPISAALDYLQAENGDRLPYADKRVISIGRASLYGGRTEVPFQGTARAFEKKKKGGVFWHFDFNAQYGRAMLEKLPDYTTYYKSDRPKEKFYIARAKVRVQAKNGMGPLPFHHEKFGLCFPQGVMRGYWTNYDLEMPGVEVMDYEEVVNFPYSGYFLRPLVSKLLPTAADDLLTRKIKKNIYTGLSGKFSQGNEYCYFMKWNSAKPVDYWTGVHFGDHVFTMRTGQYPKHSNFVWSSMIQAHAKRWLWDLFEAAWGLGGDVLNVDTDGGDFWLPNDAAAKEIFRIFGDRLKGEPLRVATGKGEGAQSYETEWFSPKVCVLVPRDKKRGVMISAKGVPRRAVAAAIAAGEEAVEADVPDSFLQLLRQNQVANGQVRNNWRSRKFRFSRRNTNRNGERGGWTKPHALGI